MTNETQKTNEIKVGSLVDLFEGTPDWCRGEVVSIKNVVPGQSVVKISHGDHCSEYTVRNGDMQHQNIHMR